MKFADGNYGIRKRLLFFSAYLDITDNQLNSNEVNWRTRISCPRVYSWCTTSSITEANTALKNVLDKKITKVKVMSEKEILKELNDEKDNKR